MIPSKSSCKHFFMVPAMRKLSGDISLAKRETAFVVMVTSTRLPLPSGVILNSLWNSAPQEPAEI